MSWAAAACNILGSYRFQLRLRGDLPARLSYASLYWGSYLYAKHVKGVAPAELNFWALKFLGKTGRTARRVKVQLPDGAWLKVDQLTCFMVLKEICADRIYEFPGRDFAARPGEVVFDVGAQQGTYTTLCARRVGAEGLVVSFEPEPGNFSALKENLALNGFSDASVLALALSDKKGRLTLHQNPYNTGGHSLTHDEGGAGVQVEVSTLDDVIAERKLPEPDLLKIDVEGSALAVLRGGAGLLARKKPRVALELDRLEDEAAARALLEPLGYRVERRSNNLFAWPG